MKVKKFGRAWHSTMGNIKEFEEKMRQQKEERNERLRKSYIEKAEKVKISVMDERKAEEILKEVEDDTELVQVQRPEPTPGDNRGNDTIFDEVQEELAEILHEIRNKEKKLRHSYLIYRGNGGKNDEISKRARHGDDAMARDNNKRVSEDLISDLGKLLKTASIIHEKAELEKRNEMSSKKRNLHDALRIEHKNHDHLLGNYHKDNFLSVPYSYFPFEDKANASLNSKSIPFHNKVLLFISGVMVFIAAVLLVLVLVG